MAKRTKPAETTEPTAAGLADYVVTEKAPSKVADRRVQAGDKLTLTDDQARFDELAGHIRKLPAAAPAAS